MSHLPEFTEVERLTLYPGDILFVHVDADLSAQQAASIRKMVKEVIGRTDVEVFVAPRGVTVKVVRPEDP